ncbi:hypothetical protein EZS27_043196, partial [termite gut metagenome]
TNPYGKPAQIFEHEGSMDVMGDALKQMLETDLSRRLNLDLYNAHSPIQQKQTPLLTVPAPQEEKRVEKILEVNVSQPVMSLYDLFGFSQEERTQIKPKRGTKRIAVGGKPAQLNLFNDNRKPDSTNPVSPQPRPEKPKLSFELRPFSETLQSFHKEGSLIEDKEQVGVLKNRYEESSDFQPLDLPSMQRA